ncbi:MAG: type II secretion system F family protein [Candidatus Omnitrophica bacterium]|nr:type II secretion system F family protein [Candidatus Omnitrophota bacterium]
MAFFTYVVRDAAGKRLTGQEEGITQEEIVARLQGRSLTVISVRPLRTAKTAQKAISAGPSYGPGRFKTKIHNKVSVSDRVIFCRQLATLLGAGVTILEALTIISRQISSRQLANVLSDLKKNMEAGLSLHEAMARHPKVFSDLWVNLVESGEASGNLATILSRLSTYLERDAQFRSKITSALIYPMLLMTVGVGALFFLTIKIIPTFAQLFTSFEMELPFLTQVLITTSSIMRRFFLVFIIGAGVLIYLGRLYLQRPEGKHAFENFLFKLPVFGLFFRSLTVERFTSGMATLVESGVPILYALEISERSVGSVVVADIVRNIKEQVRQGRSLNQPMEASGFFEPMVVEMVTIGEEVGDLAGMFRKVNMFYQEYVETFLTRFTSMFEPIMLVFMGLIIGIMVLGMFLPIFQISQIARGM